MPDPGNDRLVHEEVRREPRDVSLRGVVWVAIATVIVVAIHLTVVYRQFALFERRQDSAKASTFPLAPNPSDRLPAEPRLEALEYAAGKSEVDVAHSYSAIEQVLNSYGPAADKGFVHIPIKRAIEIAAGRLPVREQHPSSFRERGLVDGGESNSGRTFREPRR